MPLTQSTTQQATSVSSAIELEGVITADINDGDLAFLQSVQAYRRLRVGAGNGATVPAQGNKGAWVPPNLGLGVGTVSWSPSGNGDAKTWAEVVEYLAQTSSPLQILLLDPSTTYVAGTPGVTTDMKRGTFAAAPGDPSLHILEIADGATLDNLAGASGGMKLIGQGTTVSPLTYTAPGTSLLFLSNGVNLQNNGLVPMIGSWPTASGQPMVVGLLQSSGIAAGTNNAPILALGGARLFAVLAVVEALGIVGLTPVVPATWITGDGTTSLLLESDGFNFDLVATWAPGFTGTLINAPFAQRGGAGPTTHRPGTPPFGSPPVNGTQYTDTTLNKIIWWSSATSQWLDAMGVPV